MSGGAEYVGSLIGAVVIGVPVVYLLVKNDLERRRHVRALRKTPPIDAAAGVGQTVFAIGSVKLVEEPLVGPLSEKRCVAHRSRLYIGTFDSYSKKREQIGLTKFALQRRDGSIVTIDATHARFTLPALSLPPGSDDRCKQFAIARAVASGDRRVAKYEEVLVLEGMRLAVAGTLATEPGEPARLTGDEKSPIIIGVPF